MVRISPPSRGTRRAAAGLSLLCALGMFALGGCASQKATMEAPQLPAKHWLEEAPGIPVDKKEKVSAAVPNLYQPGKVFGFDDCIYLAVQQSPLLVNSAVNLEIKKLALTNAVWKYLPEPHMTIIVSNNLTRYNEDNKDTPDDYGHTKFRIGFYAPFPNPIQTFFEHQAQKLMVNVAISTHRKAVGEAIAQIADLYLRMYAKQLIYKEQKAMIPLMQEIASYWKQVESVDGRQGVAVNVAQQNIRDAELKAEKTAMEEVMLRTKLKILAGIDPKQTLEIEARDVLNIVQSFDGRNLRWEDRWNMTEDNLLLRAQVKLRDFNIMVAWAAYVPHMTISMNHNPPAGQYQPASGDEDTFVHLNIDFPLIDWGRRYRGVQTARMVKAQAFHEQARKRDDYSNSWLQAEQNVSLAETQKKLAWNSLKVAELKREEADISYREGLVEFPVLADARQAEANARIAAINAQMELELAKLQWMQLASVLQERYLGVPTIEGISNEKK
ncbi:MAG: TolC family protein [Desulfovibrionaceae bacterium]|nr:TolC family protein [Desulfovibrionaceae bacterium]